jgi:S1-C subfamily serine protease
MNLGMGFGLLTSCTMISGDSGGPLFDLQGRVIGIHSTIGPSAHENNHATLQQAEEQWEDFLGNVEVGESVLEQTPGWRRGESLDQPSGSIQKVMDESSAARFLAREQSVEDSWEIEPGLKDCVRQAVASTVRILGDGEAVSLGTVVSAAGEILCKASVLTGIQSLQCELPSGETVDAKLLATVESYDLALLQVEAQGLAAIAFASEASEPAVGSLLLSPGFDGEFFPPAVVSVPAMAISDRMTPVVAVLGQGASSDAYVQEISSMSGETSERRTRFARAFTHDTVFWAGNCGGPIVGIHGRALGINIARYSRTASYAVPGAAVLKVLEQLRRAEPTAPH